MWITFALISMLCLGFYDVFKKRALEGNNIFVVLLLNTLFCTLIMSPALVITATSPDSNFVIPQNHVLLLIKSLIVTTSWFLGYYAIKHLPLTMQASINAVRPILVLVGALIIFGERPNLWQWAGIILGFISLLWIGFIGSREQMGRGGLRWMLAGALSVLLWAISGLYDKYLMQHFRPLNVEAWYSFYQLLIMLVVLAVMRGFGRGGQFRWRWSILAISIFICAADLSYFYCLSAPDSLVSVASMIRRGSAMVAFFYGVFVLHERNVKYKLIDQLILIAGVVCMLVGSL